MKNKILIIFLATSLLVNTGGFAYYENKISNAETTISNLQDNVQTKSTEIAKLDSVIKNKNEKIVKQQKVIDNNIDAINELKLKAKQLKSERDKALIEKQALVFKKEKEGSDVGGRKITVEATAYIAMCSEGCTGRTATGVDVSNSIYYKGYRVIAVDTSLIPLYSLVKVETENGTFTAMAIDTGGAIHGHIIDVLVSSESKARQFGRKKATLTVLREGK